MTNMIKKQNGYSPAHFGSVAEEFFPNNLTRLLEDAWWGFNGLDNARQLPVNVQQTENGYEIELVAPGYARDEFKIELEGKVLTVSVGQKKQEDDQPAAPTRWITQEFKRIALSRTFTVDDTIDTGRISAKYQDGTLRLDLPIKEQAKPVNRQINVE